MYDSISFIADVFTITAAVVAIFGVYVAWKQLRDNNLLRRAEYYSELNWKFYNDTKFRRVRSAIEDFNQGNDGIHTQMLTKILGDDSLTDNETREFEEDLTDYLNFFEHLTGLIKLGQLNQTDVHELFDYYIRQLGNTEQMRSYVNRVEYGYEGIRKVFLK